MIGTPSSLIMINRMVLLKPSKMYPKRTHHLLVLACLNRRQAILKLTLLLHMKSLPISVSLLKMCVYLFRPRAARAHKRSKNLMSRKNMTRP